MNPASDEAMKSPAAGMTSRPLAQARRLCGIEVPSALSDIADAIDKSRSILDLPDDWDDEGSPRYAPETWERAVRFVLKNTVNLWRSEQVRVPAPAIHNGPAGSIDLHWKTRGAELLINVPPSLPERPATYYGLNAETGLETKGHLETSAPSEWLLKWIVAQ
jgi:hypothetical protein